MIKTECRVATLLRFSVVRWGFNGIIYGCRCGVGGEGVGQARPVLSSFYPAAALLGSFSVRMNVRRQRLLWPARALSYHQTLTLNSSSLYLDWVMLLCLYSGVGSLVPRWSSVSSQATVTICSRYSQADYTAAQDYSEENIFKIRNILGEIYWLPYIYLYWSF